MLLFLISLVGADEEDSLGVPLLNQIDKRTVGVEIGLVC